jgi:riboflavin kinase, archaea type
MQVRGRLVRGLGEASDFTQLPWVVDQCYEKLGFRPYPGTVNLEVVPEDLSAWEEMKRQPGVTLSPPNPAFCDAVCHAVAIDGQLKAATIVPHVAGYPADKLELLASGPVLETLGLSQGQEVTVRLRSCDN